MKNPERLKPILSALNNQETVSQSVIEELSKLFTLERVLKALEYISMDHVHHYKFEPSGRSCWFVAGREHYYYIRPYRFCSCKDFFLRGVIKKGMYLCKHLIAQAIFENLNKDNIKDENIEFSKDEDFWDVFEDCI